MKINKERLKNNLLDLSKIGYVEGQGIRREAFTAAYTEASEFVKDLMKSAGLTVYEDPVGNIFGKYEGKQKNKSILLGSHIDTVPNGGMFDGSLGVLGALECIQALKDNNCQSNYSIEVGAFIGEEGTQVGGTFGSRIFTGEFEYGKNELDYLSTVGISEEDLIKSKRDPSTLKCYLELHIEQGNILNTEDISIGLVKGIVGIAQYNACVTGKANHAGTTPMHLRDDALVKTSKIITNINNIVNELGSPLVGTVGYIKAHPGAINVIPGKVEFTIELRDMEKEKVEKAMEMIMESSKDLDLRVEPLGYEWEVNLDQGIQKLIEESCKDLNYSYKYMYSGAGHDANPLSKITPTGMIFIPSKNGISHSPDEWSDWDDVEKGANVLLNTILKIDNK
ncbi:MAG: M20 family metallo-hydrolase [Tissierellia bacterium]|nr:M20 family metallo-hydrolase [Tissierellia bacterium]